MNQAWVELPFHQAMVTFCSDVGTDVSVHLDDPGRWVKAR